MVEVPWPSEALLLSIVKAGGSTVSGNCVDAVCEPEVPVTVTRLPARAAVLLAVRVRVELVCMGFGENDAVTPAGRPLKDRLTAPVNPEMGVILM